MVPAQLGCTSLRIATETRPIRNRNLLSSWQDDSALPVLLFEALIIPSQVDGPELEPFKDITKRFEGKANNGSYGSLWEVLPSMDFMLGPLESHATRLAQPPPKSYFKIGVDLG
jgi:hypothetical protein